MKPIKKAEKEYVEHIAYILSNMDLGISQSSNTRENNTDQSEIKYEDWALFVLFSAFPNLLIFLIMALGAVQYIITAISYTLSGPAAKGIGKAISKCIDLIIKDIVDYMGYMIVGFEVGVILEYVISKLPEYFNFCSQTILIATSLLYFIKKVIENEGKLKMSRILKYHKDLFGLMVSIIAYTIYLYLSFFNKDYRKLMTVVSFGLALTGFLITIFVHDKGDELWSIPWIEEGLTAGVLGMTAFDYIVMSKRSK